MVCLKEELISIQKSWSKNILILKKIWEGWELDKYLEFGKNIYEKLVNYIFNILN
jgi:hypothetical protein